MPTKNKDNKKKQSTNKKKTKKKVLKKIDNRRYSRFGTKLTYLAFSDHGYIQNKLNDISLGGAFIETKDFIFKASEKISLVIHNERLLQNIYLMAEISYQDDNGYGLKFLTIEPESSFILQELVRKLRGERHEEELKHMKEFDPHHHSLD